MAIRKIAVAMTDRSILRDSFGDADDDFQERMLQGVSRTFALTIPQLPEALRRSVGNGYLLCRIVDTIEDDAALSVADKRAFCTEFVAVVKGESSAEDFAHRLKPRLAPTTPAMEQELIEHTARVISICHHLPATQRQALEICAGIMADGMASFQEKKDVHGLATQAEMDRYCYYVAGVVGEMLTRLFCDYSPAIAQHADKLMPLAVSFGQALQMTNILKDIWEDRERGACWLPRDIFGASHFDLKRLEPGIRDPGFQEGLGRLIAIAHGHAYNALRYTLLLPSEETGLRNFCLWALGMAVLTLRKIDRHRTFSAGQQVKITRRSVKATILGARLAVRNDWLLRLAFYVLGAGIPCVRTPMLPD